MKKLSISLIFLLLIFSVSIFAQKNSFSGNSNTSKATIARLKKNIPELMKKADVPGMSVALIQNGKLVWNEGFGVKNAETKEVVTNETVFEAASLSKPVVAYAVLKLVDEGKIDLDIPLKKILGNNYDVGDDERLNLITARRVLSHSSGFPNWRRPFDSKILLINFKPGEKFSYSGEGFVYLSKVVEKITNMKFEDFIKKMVFEPLEMKSSSFIWQDRFDKLKVFNHDLLGNVSGRNERKESNAAASLETTAEDYAKFVVAVLNGKGLKKQTHAQMLTPQIKVNEEKAPKLSWGLGVGLQDDEKGKSFWHWGDNGNNKSFMIASVGSKNAIVYFANASNGLSFLHEILSVGIGGENPAIAWLDYERYDSPARILLKDIIANGAENSLKTYRESRKKSASESINESQMNRLGYMLLRIEKKADALEVFKQNAEDFPKSANVWDSLAEGYLENGEKELAIKFYKKSLELDPENKNAEDKIKELGSK